MSDEFAGVGVEFTRRCIIATEMDTNVIYCGDNLEVMPKYLHDESVDLIYIDPPFNTSRQYEVFWGEGQEKRAFDDRFGYAMTYQTGCARASGSFIVFSNRLAASTTTATGTHPTTLKSSLTECSGSTTSRMRSFGSERQPTMTRRSSEASTTRHFFTLRDRGSPSIASLAPTQIATSEATTTLSMTRGGIINSTTSPVRVRGPISHTNGRAYHRPRRDGATQRRK